jgi:hypothetical protein
LELHTVAEDAPRTYRCFFIPRHLAVGAGPCQRQAVQQRALWASLMKQLKVSYVFNAKIARSSSVEQDPVSIIVAVVEKPPKL